MSNQTREGFPVSPLQMRPLFTVRSGQERETTRGVSEESAGRVSPGADSMVAARNDPIKNFDSTELTQLKLVVSEMAIAPWHNRMMVQIRRLPEAYEVLRMTRDEVLALQDAGGEAWQAHEHWDAWCGRFLLGLISNSNDEGRALLDDLAEDERAMLSGRAILKKSSRLEKTQFVLRGKLGNKN